MLYKCKYTAPEIRGTKLCLAIHKNLSLNMYIMSKTAMASMVLIKKDGKNVGECWITGKLTETDKLLLSSLALK
jgi:hypothetical protein